MAAKAGWQARDMSAASHSVSVDAQGRIRLPVDVRRRLGLVAGSKVHLSVDDDGVRLQDRRAAWERVRRLFSAAPSGTSVVDELLAERRSEAARDGW